MPRSSRVVLRVPHGLGTALLRAVAGGAISLAAAAQCGTQWLPDPGQAGAIGSSTSASWDPDGAGPLPALLAVGGSFQTIGRVAASYLATYDPVQRTYAPFGAGADGPVSAVLGLANGVLVVGGNFTSIGGVAAPGIARFQSGVWSPLGPALAPPALGVTCLLEMPNGDLVAAGGFTSIGGVAANRIARWTGTVWAPMDVGFSNTVSALAVRPNGELFAGGALGQSTGNNSMQYVARWTGTGWTAVANGSSYLDSYVHSLLAHSNGDLIAGGVFPYSSPGLPQRVARWDGTAWLPMGAGFPASDADVTGLVEEPNGDVIAIGKQNDRPLLQRWNGTAWTDLAAGTGPAAGAARTIARTAAGELLIGVDGSYGSFQTRVANGVWTSDVAGFDQIVHSLALGTDGAVLASGSFTLADGTFAAFVARHSGTAWQPLGLGTNQAVGAMDVLPNGDVVVAGAFTRAGGVAAPGVARWNGTQWSPLPWLQPIVDALAHSPSGEIYAARPMPSSRYAVARGTGSSWTDLGPSPWFNVEVLALAVMPNGDVIAGGHFTQAGFTSASRIARWNGTSWAPLGSGMNQAVHALRVLPNGNLVAAGLFTTAGGAPAPNVAAWNGSAWSALGTGPGAAVYALDVLPDGDLVAGGEFAGGHPLARWNGTNWSPMGAPSPGLLTALLVHPDGRVLTAQLPTSASAAGLGFLRELAPLCPATAQSYGNGCAGSAGTMALSASALPWVGGTCRTVCTGFAPNGIGVTLVGFGQLATPLASIVPVAAPGCTLLATADAVALAFPAAGAVQWQLAIPEVPALLGVQLRHQIGQVEWGPNQQITSASASNGLVLTIGLL